MAELPGRLQLEIVTPEKLLFSGEVDEVVVPGEGGALGILPGHAALLSKLETGVLTYRQGSRRTRLYCDWGFVEVLPDSVSVLAESALKRDEVDVGAAEADKAEAERILYSKDPAADYPAAVRLLRQAVARLDVAGA